MIDEHLSDEQIQELAIDRSAVAASVQAHVQRCEQCSAKVEAYQLVIAAIDDQPVPAFDFDISEVVLAQIVKQQKSERYRWLYWLIALGILVSGGAIYLFWQYIALLFTGINIILICLTVITGLLIMTAMIIDMLRTYRNNCNKLHAPASHHL